MNPRAEWQLDTQRLGRRVIVYDLVDSTSTRAEALAGDPANDGVVVLAQEQSAGRGQYGRSWQCPGGAGVLMSVLLFPPPSLGRAAVVTAWAAVSVCELIRKTTGLQPRIKWPNDILIHGSKVCGILIEQGRGTVTGIGLNINQPAAYFAAAYLPLATSLALETGQAYDCADMARLLIRELDEQFDRLYQGDVATLEASWKRHLGLVGKQVAAEGANEEIRGRLRELTFAGLELERADGTLLHVSPESVRQLREAGAPTEARSQPEP
jgi:BirA family transcriptional regulator, biotin operon repressor / biotin---[acetyl-CoA-carboxylase] ligase